MSKFYKPLKDILSEIITSIAPALEVLAVVNNAGESQTLTVCNTYYAQKGFLLTINEKSYTIASFNYAEKTITVTPNFTTDPTITVGTVFNLYSPKFFHGTPVTTDVETSQLSQTDAFAYSPMVWLWENFEESFFAEEMIERVADNLELYALTQTPQEVQQMINDDIHLEAVEPMDRLVSCVVQAIKDSVYFETDEFTHRRESFPKFGIIARNKGAEKSVMLANLSGKAMYTSLQIIFADDCPCPVVVEAAQFDDSFDNSFA